MQLTYAALEQTLMGHFRIHPDMQGTFRSRMKQLKRLEFPPSVNVGQGTKAEYTATHLFQFITAFELIGSNIPAERATKLTLCYWPQFATAYSLAVQSIRRWRKQRIFLWIIARSLYGMQTDPFPAKLPLSDCPDGARVAVGDDGGFADQLLARNQRRQAHCYTFLPISDLVTQALKALEERGGYPRARLDAEFMDWLPEKSDEMKPWLFVESFDPWEEEPTAYTGGVDGECLATSEMAEQMRFNELMPRVLANLEQEVISRPLMNDDPMDRDEISAGVQTAAKPIADQLSDEAAAMLKAPITGQSADLDRDALQQLFEFALIQPHEDHVHVTMLGWAVAYELTDRAAAAEAESGQVIEMPPAGERRSKRKA